jgi:hypothetical protein
MLSTMLEFVSLWQIEIVSWNQDEFFEFPFFLFICNKWVARDIWYAVQVIAWLLGMASAYSLAIALQQT